MPFCVGSPADAIRCFLRGRKDYRPKACALHNLCEKRGMFIVSQALPINNPWQILARVAVITPQGSVRGNRKGGQGGFGHKSHGNPSLRESPTLNHLLASLAAVIATLMCRSMNTHTRTHTHSLQSACFSPVQTQIRLYSLGPVSGTHQAVCTAISSLLLSMFCPLSFQWDYVMLSSCRNIN